MSSARKFPKGPIPLSGLSLAQNNTQIYDTIKVIINGHEQVKNIDNGIETQVKNAIIEFHDTNKNHSLIYLWQLDNEKAKLFSSYNKNTSIQFYFAEDQITTCLPKKINDNLVEFFKLYKPTDNKDYCCLDFAYEMAYGRNSLKEGTINLSIDGPPSPHNTQNEKHLTAGKIISLFKYPKTGDGKISHHAIYLDNGYYLSLFGTQGPLKVASLESMQKIYESDIAIVFEEKMENKNLKYLTKSPHLFFSNKEPEANKKESNNDKYDKDVMHNDVYAYNL
jgi:hypothetical protein